MAPIDGYSLTYQLGKVFFEISFSTFGNERRLKCLVTLRLYSLNTNTVQEANLAEVELERNFASKLQIYLRFYPKLI